MFQILKRSKNRLTRDLRLAQQARNYEDTLDLKVIEYKELLEKFLKMETDYSVLYETNRRLNEELERLRSMLDNNRYNVTVTTQNEWRPPANDTIIVRKDRNLWAKMETILDMKQRSHDKEIMHLMYTVWRHKFALRANKRLEVQLSQMKLGSQGAYTTVENVRTIHDGLLLVLTYLRESVVDLIFEVFVRSVSSASHKKQNSLILFIINVRELKSTKLELLMILVEAYMRVRTLAKKFIPTFSHQHQRLVDVVMGGRDRGGEFSQTHEDNFHQIDHIPNQEVYRDNINKWIEGTLASCINKYNNNPTEKNRDFLFLYRLLTIAYRIKFPLRGRSLNPDIDLKVYLQHKICSAFRRVVLAEQELVVTSKLN